MAYHLYVNSLEDKKNKIPSKESRPLYFDLDGKRKNSFKITEIDTLLCQYKSSKNLIKALQSYGYIHKNENNVKLILGLNSNNKRKEIPIFYNNQFLATLAISFRELKSNNNLINKTKELSNFIKYIKSLALNKTTRNYVLDTKKIVNLTNEEQFSLSSYFPKEYKINNDNRTIVGIGGLLQSYVYHVEQIKALKKKGQSFNIEEKELNEINLEIDNYFRSDYQHIRKIIEWEDLYRKILDRHINNSKEEKTNFEILCLQINKIDIARENRNNPLAYNEIVYEDEESLYEVLSESKNKEINNEMLEYLYRTGGSEEVFKYMDIDELYDDNNIESSKNIGIISHNK